MKDSKSGHMDLETTFLYSYHNELRYYLNMKNETII